MMQEKALNRNAETNQVQLSELIPLIQERLAAGQSVRFSPRGISMLPMLRQGIDSVVLSSLPEQIKKYDLVLYQRDNGKYVLHRVVVTGQTYTCMGDNQFVMEPGIRYEQMIGVVSTFYRGEKPHRVDALSHWIYCRLWFHSRYLRHFIARSINWVRRHMQ